MERCPTLAEASAAEETREGTAGGGDGNWSGQRPHGDGWDGVRPERLAWQDPPAPQGRDGEGRGGATYWCPSPYPTGDKHMGQGHLQGRLRTAITQPRRPRAEAAARLEVADGRIPSRTG